MTASTSGSCSSRRGRALIPALSAVLLLLPAGLAYSDGGQASGTSTTSGSAGGSGGSQQIAVSVVYRHSEGGSGGGGVVVSESSTTAVASVEPVCRYSPGSTGKEKYEWFNSQGTAATAAMTGESVSDWKRDYPDLDQHKDDTEGRWYSPECRRSSSSDMSSEEYRRISSEFFANNGPVFVPAGGTPPAPLIDGKTLAEAAWDAVSIPDPHVDYNPRLGSSGGTLVGFQTWVWATETPAEVIATATAGPVTATVTARSSGLSLSGPDLVEDCEGFGRPWAQDAGATDCSVTFTRSSAHLGGTTPVKISVSYRTEFTASDGAGGALDTVTTTSTVSIPVAEAQVLNSTGKPSDP